MSKPGISQLIRVAIDTGDAAAMREALTRLLAGGPEALSPEAEYQLRHPDYVMEMPQSGERIRGRDAMRAMQEAFPRPPSITIRRVIGTGRTWTLEGANDYGDDVWHVVVIFEFGEDGRIVRDTRYYGRPFPAPEWRERWAERL